MWFLVVAAVVVAEVAVVLVVASIVAVAVVVTTDGGDYGSIVGWELRMQILKSKITSVCHWPDSCCLREETNQLCPGSWW